MVVGWRLSGLVPQQDIADVIVPELVLVGLDFMKARPVEEGRKRFVYCEASNESRDQQGERIMKAALLASRDLFLTRGNIDTDHITMIGYRLGIQNPRAYEIGLPCEVLDTPNGVLVKGEIYSGNQHADWWWSTQTTQDPPMRWYPSVGGKPTHKKKAFDPEHGGHTVYVTKCDWKNLAFAREPQNLSVRAASIHPTGDFAAFAKSVTYSEFAEGVRLGEAAIECTDGHCTCTMTKSVTAGADIGPAGLTGGGALRLQSIERGVADPWASHAQRYMKAMLEGGALACEHRGANVPSSFAELRNHFVKCEGMSESEAKPLAARVLGSVGKLTKQAA